MKSKVALSPQTVITSLAGGERKYRIKKNSLSQLEGKNGQEGSFIDLDSGKSKAYTQFEKHMIQEGIKQVLFAQGSEEVEVRYPYEVGVEGNRSIEYSTMCQRIVPKEVIQFLLDYDMIEEYNYNG